jgi:hypothetical protein
MSQAVDPDVLRAAGREFAERRRVVVSQCIVCGTEMRAIQVRRYCSDACRARAYRKRKQRAMQAEAGEPGSRDILKEATVQRTEQAKAAARLLALRDTISRGRIFADATEIIRQHREDRSRDLHGDENPTSSR